MHGAGGRAGAAAGRAHLLELRDEGVVELEAVLGEERNVRHGGRRVERHAVEHLGRVERDDAALARLGGADRGGDELGESSGGGSGGGGSVVVLISRAGLRSDGDGGRGLIRVVVVVAVVGVVADKRVCSGGGNDGRVSDLGRAQGPQLLRGEGGGGGLPDVVGEVVVALAVHLRGVGALNWCLL